MDWVAAAKEYKQLAVKQPDPNLCPIVIAERDNKVWAVVESPTLDKRAGLYAAEIIKKSLDPDVLVCVFDAYIKSLDFKKGDSIQEALSHIHSGQLQEEKQQGNPEVMDALMCISINRQGIIDSTNLVYKQDGDQLVWLNEFKTEGCVGTIPEALREILNLPLLVDSEIWQFAPGFKNLDRTQQVFHTARGSFMWLREIGYKVTDKVSERHLDWLMSS